MQQSHIHSTTPQPQTHIASQHQTSYRCTERPCHWQGTHQRIKWASLENSNWLWDRNKILLQCYLLTAFICSSKCTKSKQSLSDEGRICFPFELQALRFPGESHTSFTSFKIELNGTSRVKDVPAVQLPVPTTQKGWQFKGIAPHPFIPYDYFHIPTETKSLLV